MFKFLKKTKNQVTENVEKNKNISVESNIILPSANDSLEKTRQKWKFITSEEIVKEIKFVLERGNREACFWNSCISDELLKELRDKGYKVEVNADSNIVGPYFKIYW